MDQLERSAVSRAQAALNIAAGGAAEQSSGAGEFVALARALALADGDPLQAQQRALLSFGCSRAHEILKAAVGGGTTSDATWAGALAPYRSISNGFIESLKSISAFDAIVPFARSMPLRTQIAAVTVGAVGGAVSAGMPTLLTKLALSAPTLEVLKALSVVVLTDALLRNPSGAAMALVSRELRGAVSTTTNTAFFDAIRDGASTVVSTGTSPAESYADIRLALAELELGATSTLFLAVPAARLARLSTITTTDGLRAFPDLTPTSGTIAGIRVLPVDVLTQTVAGSPETARDVAVLLDADGLAVGNDVITLDVSGESALEFLDNPTNSPLLTGSPQTTTATTMTSLFQTGSKAIRAMRFFGAERIRSSVCVISAVEW